MKYKINGREASRAEAHAIIREALPNGGVKFLENTIRNCRREKLESVILHVGTKCSVEVIFKVKVIVR